MKVREKQRQSTLLLLVLGVAIGAAAETFGPGWFPAIDITKAAGITSLLAALAVSILLHEAGHFIAALCMDFQVLGWRLGPVRAARTDERWKIRFSWRGLFGGSVSAIPRDNQFWRLRMLTVVAAGPIATLMTGIAAANFALGNSVPAGWLGDFVNALMQCNLLLFVLGLIPNNPNAQARNDARLILLLCRRTAEAQQILLYHIATQLQLEGIRPRDYPAELMEQLSAA